MVQHHLSILYSLHRPSNTRHCLILCSGFREPWKYCLCQPYNAFFDLPLPKTPTLESSYHGAHRVLFARQTVLSTLCC